MEVEPQNTSNIEVSNEQDIGDTVVPISITGNSRRQPVIGTWMITFIHIAIEALLFSALAVYFYKKTSKHEEEIAELRREINGLKEAFKIMSDELSSVKQTLNIHLSNMPAPRPFPSGYFPHAAGADLSQPQQAGMIPPPQPPPSQPQVESTPPPNEKKIINAVVENPSNDDDIEAELMNELLNAQKHVDDIRSAQETPTPKKSEDGSI